MQCTVQVRVSELSSSLRGMMSDMFDVSIMLISGNSGTNIMSIYHALITASALSGKPKRSHTPELKYMTESSNYYMLLTRAIAVILKLVCQHNGF